ncbi:MAG TPA: dienelactone hydrolase family protein, partial [Gemmatimonadales bacterium]|nr:dienelactone hydrolase family protein [Gemmatimonadales bacterium]
MRLRPPLSLVAFLLAPPLYAQSSGGSDQADYSAAMYRAHAAETPAPNASAQAPRQDVVAEEVTYGTLDGVPLKGYLARPASGSRGLPGIVVVHEWWGLNDNIRMMTRRLAGEGYVALAVDLYGGHTATTPDEAV